MMRGSLWAAGLVTFTVAVAPTAALGSGSLTCGGSEATIVGTTGDDNIVGTDGPDVIVGLSGADTIDARDGDDVICAGFADGETEDGDRDEVRAGDGEDFVLRSGGGDDIDGGSDGDYLEGGSGADSIDAGTGTGNYAAGGEDDDRLIDHGTHGYLEGGVGDDELTSDSGYLDGGDGDDVLVGGPEQQYLQGGVGDDRLHGGGGINSSTTQRDYLDGGDGNDTLVGSSTGEEYLDGGDGDDLLQSGGGASDYLDAGAGHDRLEGGAGSDEYLDGGSGDDRLQGRGGDDTVDGGDGNDQLAGQGGADTFIGGDGNDVLSARDGQTDAKFDCGPGHDFVLADDPADNGVERLRCNAPGSPADTDVDVPGARLDSDGDALLDDWENHGFDSDGNGQVDVDLPALGAKAGRKDVFVAVAWLKDTTVDLEPADDAFDPVVKAFDDAPVANIDGSSGIALHITRVGAIPRTASNRLLDDYDPACNYDWLADVEPAKDLVLSRRKRAVYHFALVAEAAVNCEGVAIGGKSRNASDDTTLDPVFGLGASDFFLSQGNNPDPAILATTFMHELGHNLGLGHGGVTLDGSGRKLGVDHVTYEPNHLSVMNYAFSNNGLLKQAPAGSLLTFSLGHLDYSRFSATDLPDLDETNLDENVGLRGSSATTGYMSTSYCPSDTAHHFPRPPFTTTASVNWDCFGDAKGTHIHADINADVGTAMTTANEWQHLVYDGGGVGAANAVVELPASTPTTGRLAEPTIAQLAATAIQTALTPDPVIRLSTLQIRVSAALAVPGSGVLPGRTLTFTTPQGRALCSARTNTQGRATCTPPLSLATVQAILAGGFIVRYAGETGLRGSQARGLTIAP